jgi:cytochrome c peroxidase
MKKKFSIFFAITASVLLLTAFIDLNNPDNYTAPGKPLYINKDNTPLNNPLTNKGATLGRVLFYDKQLSANTTISCASCHLQQFAFSDTAALSKGHLGGNTGRHAMRLVNARFGNEQKFFWNERASSLEDQTTRPLKDAVEMGWSGNSGQGNIDSLIKRIKSISYYKQLFPYVFGDSAITESRIQFALAQFIRSIQSFDSKFDAGLLQTNNLAANFPNYTAQENQGKSLFLAPPNAGGAGCQGCHAAPEFDIDPNTLNNGIIAVAGATNTIDLFNTRAPSLRNLFNPNGNLNGPLMHNAIFKTIDQVVNHYNNCPQAPINTNLDPRLQGPGGTLNLTQTQKNALIAFLKTLSGTALYTDPKWSDPFEKNGSLNVLTGLNELTIAASLNFKVYPNPAGDQLNISVKGGDYQLRVYDAFGRLLLQQASSGVEHIELSSYPSGILFIELSDAVSHTSGTQRIIHQ